MTNKIKFLKKINPKAINIVLITLIVLLILSSNSFAGTDGGELAETYNKLTGIVGGYGGKIIGLLGIVLAAISWLSKSNFTVIGTAIGIILMLGSAASFIGATITCLMLF